MFYYDLMTRYHIVKVNDKSSKIVRYKQETDPSWSLSKLSVRKKIEPYQSFRSLKSGMKVSYSLNCLENHPKFWSEHKTNKDRSIKVVNTSRIAKDKV